jgi:putative peptidoglycan lipid II flippase
MLAIVVLLNQQAGDWFQLSAGARALWMSAVVVAGLGGYFLALALLGFRLRDFRAH